MPGRSKLLTLLLGFLLCATTSLWADIVIQRDGLVILGKLKSAGTGVLVYTSLGKDVTVRTADVIRTETSLESAKDLFLEITLKDGSILKGSISDYDEDIGLFVDMGFGIVTVPVDNIVSIYQPKQRDRYNGAKTMITTGFSLMQPIGDPGAHFGLGYGPVLDIEAAIPGARGLFVGGSFGAVFMDYTVVPEVDYATVDALARLTWKLLELRTEDSVAAWFAPFASLGGGAVFTMVTDNRPGALERNIGAVNPAARFDLGVEINPVSFLSITLAGGLLATFESAGPFFQLGGSLSVGVLF